MYIFTRKHDVLHSCPDVRALSGVLKTLLLAALTCTLAGLSGLLQPGPATGVSAGDPPRVSNGTASTLIARAEKKSTVWFKRLGIGGASVWLAKGSFTRFRLNLMLRDGRDFWKERGYLSFGDDSPRTSKHLMKREPHPSQTDGPFGISSKN